MQILGRPTLGALQLDGSCEMRVQEGERAKWGAEAIRTFAFFSKAHLKPAGRWCEAGGPRAQDELDACRATGRNYYTRAKYYLLPGNRCCPGLAVLSCLTSLPTCPRRQLPPAPHAVPALSGAACSSGPCPWRCAAHRRPEDAIAGRLPPGDVSLLEPARFT